MATRIAMHSAHSHTTELTELQHALNTANFELNYEKSSRIIDNVTKDEEIRKLKLRIALTEDELEELNEQLAKEEERADLMLQDLDDANARTNDLDADVQQLMNELRVKSRELDTAKAEVVSMSDMSNDTTKVLKEKLALARELANLKPEVEHLRSQVASNQDLLAEKLSLQRQLSTIQVELDNARKSADRVSTKAGKTEERQDEYKTQIEQLKRELREAKQANRDAKTMEQELADAKKTIKELKTRSAEIYSSSGESNAQVDALRKELATEKKERTRVEKALEKAQTGWEAQKITLEDKLASFRAKLKSTKEKLKETEADLESTRESSANAAAAAANKATKNVRKRAVDPDATIGTPGDHAPAKRGRKLGTTSHVGEKSSFSITPFLNRTMSLAPESPPSGDGGSGKKRKAADDEETEEVNAEAGGEATPSAAAKKSNKKGNATKPASKALAPAPSAKQNSKPPAKRSKAAVPTLEKVTEESEIESAKKTVPVAAEMVPPKESSENTEPAYQEKKTTTTVPTALVPKLKSTMSKQPRKSLLSFATFNDEPAPEKKKKRKLLGNSSGLGKTLFDEDDGDKAPAKPIPGRGLFAKRSLLGGKKNLLGPVVTAEDGFQFSPLKKDRRAAALAQSMLGN